MIVSTNLFNRLFLVLLIAAAWSLLGCGGGRSPTDPGMPAMGSAAQAVITGQVVSRGAALSGVEVRVEGTNLSSVTDAGGFFDLAGVPTGDRVLVFEHADQRADLQIQNIRPAERIDLVVDLRGSNASLKSMNRSGGTGGGPQGCTLGYWRNHTDSWPQTGYSTSQTVESVFAQAAIYPDLGSSTLLDALSFEGGEGVEGGARLLLKQAVAALLNAAHPGVSYPRTELGVIADVDAALASGDRDQMLSLKDDLDADNNLGCPLS